MKKLVLCSLVAGAVACICISGDAFAACGATTRCGGKTVTTFAAGMVASATGAVAGGTLGLLAGPVGAGVTGIAVGTWAGFKGAKIAWDNGYDANEYIYFSNGTCLECDGISDPLDTGKECRNNQYFTNGIDLFRCDGPADTKKDDKWVKETVSVCSDSPVKKMIDGRTYKLKLKGSGETKISVGGADGFVYSSKPCRYIEEDKQTTVCTPGKIETGNFCKNITKANGLEGLEHASECHRICESDGSAWLYSIWTCEKGWKATTPFKDGGYKKCEKDKDPTPPKQTCEQMHAGYPERIACCKAGSTTTWSGDKATGTCTCVDTAKKWTFDSKTGRGQCLASGEQTCEEKFKGNDEAIQCCLAGAKWENAKCNCGSGKDWNYKDGKGECVDGGDESSGCVYTFNGTVKCANGNSMTLSKTYPLTKAELGGLTCDQFNSMYQSDASKLNAFFGQYCGGGAIISIVTGPSAAELESAKSTLSAFFSAAQSNASVWKDSEGKFNKARLASDLTAGVVLGSVGGVVSGVVIKKNQVKKGFEALHCAVGGQKVADWGDEFNVGLR